MKAGKDEMGAAVAWRGAEGNLPTHQGTICAAAVCHDNRKEGGGKRENA